MKKTILLFTLIFGLTAASLFGQSRHYNSMSLGMGSGGTSYVDGYHANFVNPANLMLKMHRPKNTIGIVGGIGVNVGGSLANIAVYNKYLTTGLLIEGETRENMLSEWFGNSSENTRGLSANFSLVPLGLSHRGNRSSFSLASRVRVLQDVGINKGTAQLLSYGLDSEIFGTPTPINFNSNTVAFAEISLGYARQIISIPNLLFAKDVKLFAGVAPKYLYGINNTKFDFNSTLHMQHASGNEPFSIDHEFNYNLRTIGEISRQLRSFETAYSLDNNSKFEDYVELGDAVKDLESAQATGYGIDLGATLQMDVSSLPIPLFFTKKKTLRISMSVTDLGKMEYDKSPSSVYAEGNFSYAGAQENDSFDSFFDNLADSLQNDVYGKFSSEETEAITYQLPAMYNFGTSLEMGKLLLAVDYGFSFYDNGTDSKRSVLNLGTQYKFLGFIPIRVGTRIGGNSSTLYSVGIGIDLNFIELSIAASNVKDSSDGGTSVGVAWSGLVIRF